MEYKQWLQTDRTVLDNLLGRKRMSGLMIANHMANHKLSWMLGLM